MRIRLISLAITLLAALALAPGAWAAPTTFTVDSTGERGRRRRPVTASARRSGCVCTLRAAIEESNATAGGRAVHDRPSTSRRSPSRDGAATDHARQRLHRRLRRRRARTSRRPTPGRRTTRSTSRCVGLHRHRRHDRPAGRRRGERPERRRDLQPRDDELPGRRDPRLGRRPHADRRQPASAPHQRPERGQRRRGPRHRPHAERRDREPGDRRTSSAGRRTRRRRLDAACDAYCNTIVNSTIAGIDLVGTPRDGPGDAPAGGDGGADEGTTIAGNWIGVVRRGRQRPRRTPSPRSSANSLDTSIGTGSDSDAATSSPGTTRASTRGRARPRWRSSTGTSSASAPTATTSVRTARGTRASAAATRSAAARSSRTAPSARPTSASSSPGPRANVIGNVFRSPDRTRDVHHRRDPPRRRRPTTPTSGRTSRRSSRLHPVPRLLQHDRATPATAHRASGSTARRRADLAQRDRRRARAADPRSADPRSAAARSARTSATTTTTPNRRNWLGRTAGPAIEVGRHATKIVIGDNEGLRDDVRPRPARSSPTSSPTPGPGNSGSANNGIQAPVDHRVEHHGRRRHRRSPARTIHVLLQEGPTVVGDPRPDPRGLDVPADAVRHDGRRRRHLGRRLPDAAEGSAPSCSPRRRPRTARPSTPRRWPPPRRNPPPVITFQSGPSGVVDTRSATFTFTSNQAGHAPDVQRRRGRVRPVLVAVHAERPGHRRPPAAGEGHRPDRQGRARRPRARGSSRSPSRSTPGGGTPTGSVAGKVRFSSVVSLPSAKAVHQQAHACASPSARRRARSSGAPSCGSARARSARCARPGRSSVSLKGLPRGKFVAEGQGRR